MTSILAKMIGLAGDDPFSPETAAILIERRSTLSRCEARMVVRDLLGVSREDLSDEVINDTLGVLLKYQDDIQHVQGAVAQRIMANAKNR